MVMRTHGLRLHDSTNQGGYAAAEDTDIGCAVRSLPPRLLPRAAEVAARINPVNAPTVVRGPDGIGVLNPMMIAVVTSKYWGPKPRTLSVSFLDNPAADLRQRILSHLNAWTRTGCIQFAETHGTGEVRIARGGGGYWSYLGTDILLIPPQLPTMNLQGFTMLKSEEEFRRVVRHEAGHTLGMPHEHMRRALVQRINRDKAYAYFLSNFGWDKKTVDQQVLTPLDEATLMFTAPDEDSIMCYQLPGSITTDGQPIRGGLDINATDYAFVAQIYPRPGSEPFADVTPRAAGEYTADDDWPAAEDVADVQIAI